MKLLCKSTLLVAFAMTLVGLVQAQDAPTFKVSHSFFVGDKLLPAGDYKFDGSLNTGEVTITQKRSGLRYLIIGVPDKSHNDPGKLVFTTANEDYYLSALQTPSFEIVFKVPNTDGTNTSKLASVNQE